jgi:metal-responsive CopG/Arc/MetJ family transcriptional regulator
MTKSLAIRIDTTLLEAVDAAASSDRRSRSEVIREALQLWLHHRTLAQKVRQHREGYRRHPVGADEFSPVLGVQHWPK